MAPLPASASAIASPTVTVLLGDSGQLEESWCQLTCLLAPGCMRMKWVVLGEQVLDRIQDAFPRCIGRLRWQPVESCRVWTPAGTAVPDPASPMGTSTMA